VNLKDSKIGSEIQSGAGILLFPISNNIMLLIMEIIYVSQELSRIFDCVGSLSSYSKRQKKKVAGLLLKTQSVVCVMPKQSFGTVKWQEVNSVNMSGYTAVM
jgi:hypothetical protein